MAYAHINNLYKNQEILLLKECFASEKIHGSSSHMKWNKDNITFSPGGEKYVNFVSLFDIGFLEGKFKELGLDEVTIYGEVYGGKMQGMKKIYGDKLKFIAFEVKIFDRWLNMEAAEKIVLDFGLEFIYYTKISTDLKVLEEERNKPSVQAKRNGILEDRRKEGIVLRPLIEMMRSDGKRIMAKYKNEEFIETKTKRKIINPDKLKVLDEANEVSTEWVTEQRLSNILDKFPEASIEQIGNIIKAMIEDVKRESEKEVTWSKEVERAIGRNCAKMFKARIFKIIV